MISFKGAYVPTDMILTGVRWYVACPLSYRHVEERMQECGVPVDHATSQRWVRSVKEGCLARCILFREASLRHALTQHVAHFHSERNHQGKGNVLLFPMVSQDPGCTAPIQCRERLGGLLKYYAREAA